jgi:hypothetical protein
MRAKRDTCESTQSQTMIARLAYCARICGTNEELGLNALVSGIASAGGARAWTSGSPCACPPVQISLDECRDDLHYGIFNAVESVEREGVALRHSSSRQGTSYREEVLSRTS